MSWNQSSQNFSVGGAWTRDFVSHMTDIYGIYTYSDNEHFHDTSYAIRQLIMILNNFPLVVSFYGNEMYLRFLMHFCFSSVMETFKNSIETAKKYVLFMELVP